MSILSSRHKTSGDGISGPKVPKMAMATFIPTGYLNIKTSTPVTNHLSYGMANF
jgi:hypothetical protein